MNDILNEAKIFLDKTMTTDNLALCTKTVTGDKTATAQLFVKIVKMVRSLPDELFYSKLAKFLSGVNFTDEDRAKMRNWIASNGTKDDNALRLVGYVENAKSMKKVEYLANATRCALNYDVSLELYFRICSAIDIATEEDLKFLADNVHENYAKAFNQTYITQKLYSAGLTMVIETILDHGKHKFNSLARLVDVCAVSFADDSRYPNPKRTINETISNITSERVGK